MHYLWRDKRSTLDNPTLYLTDYKETNEKGQLKIDRFGYVDAELIISHRDKHICIVKGTIKLFNMLQKQIENN